MNKQKIPRAAYDNLVASCAKLGVPVPADIVPVPWGRKPKREQWRSNKGRQWRMLQPGTLRVSVDLESFMKNE